MTKKLLRQTIYDSLRLLLTEEGIYASGKQEVYGCIFGRDSAISILKILKALQNKSRTFDLDNVELLSACRTTLLTLASLQGKNINPHSGEEPGKFVHEYRKANFERLTSGINPWYVYPEGVIKNYDSIDSTPLGLLAIYRYFNFTKDREFVFRLIPNIKAGLAWIINYGDLDGDQILEYKIPDDRKFGGLPVQSWTDSHESIQKVDGTMPKYPIAPVEVQGYAWLTLKLWARFFKENPEFAPSRDYYLKLREHATKMKKAFNKKFIFQDHGKYFAAQALDGDKNQIRTITGNPLLLLWAAYKINGKPYSIIKRKYIPDLVTRAFMSDMFEHGAGVRTMSKKSLTFRSGQDSYHNGSFWPKLNGLAYEGLVNFRFIKQAKKLKHATIKPIRHFGTPIELYVKDEYGAYLEYKNENGQVSCRNQAWSAAVALDILTERNLK